MYEDFFVWIYQKSADYASFELAVSLVDSAGFAAGLTYKSILKSTNVEKKLQQRRI